MQPMWLEVLVLVGATVHGGGAPAVATVVVENGEIRAIGADVETPAGATIVDGRGKHVIAGLIDGFTYHDGEHDVLYVASGVTGIVDHGNALARIFDQRELALRDAAPGPRIWTAGAVLDGNPPSTSDAVIVENADAIDGVLGKLLEPRIDFVAFQSNLPRDAWTALLGKAHAAKKRVFGPAPSGVPLLEVVRSGQDGLLFLDSFAPADGDWTKLDLDGLKETIDAIAASDLAVVPLLRGIARLAEDPSGGDRELALLSPAFDVRWRTEREIRRSIVDPGYREKASSVAAKQRALVKRLHEAGVELIVGSGAPHPWLAPGDGLIRELEQWQQAGVPAPALVELSHRAAASIVGDAAAGTLGVGASADFVLLSADPTLDVANLRAIEGVCVRGRWLSRDDLARKLEEVRDAQEVARELASMPLDIQEPKRPSGKLVMSGYSESAYSGVRTAGERWLVVEDAHGARTYSGRRRLPGGERQSEADIEVVQRVDGDGLESFEIRMRSGGHELVVRGTRVADQMRIERRLDGGFLDSSRTLERLACVDVDSVTSWLILGRGGDKESLRVLRFHAGLELEVVEWRQAVDGLRRSMRTPSGSKEAIFDERGVIVAILQQQGSGMVETRTLKVEVAGATEAGAPASGGERK